MKLPLYQVDAFTRRPFAGNPAAVCPLQSWLADRLLQAVAAENNLSETAFFVERGDGYHLRWFTPLTEVDLCGHATLATAHVLFNELGVAADEVFFETLSGRLAVRRDGDLLIMDFPVRPPEPCEPPEDLLVGLGVEPQEVLRSADFLVRLGSERQVRDLSPDLDRFSRLSGRGVMVTAEGTDADFVSRFFAPQLGIPEDPVTGSAHCALTPYWAEKLGRTTLTARQLSRRGGELTCELRGDRVIISGHAVTVIRGELYIPAALQD